MALPAESVDTIVRYQDQAAAITAVVVGYVRRVYGSLDSWREADIARFAAAVVPVVAGGQIRLAALTDSYLAALELQLAGGTGTPLGVPADVVSDEAMRGVPAGEVYRRPGSTVYGALSRGEPLRLAVAAGLARAAVLAATDLQLARTHASRYVGTRVDRIVGFRRVLSGEACSLCAGHTRQFGADELMPIHAFCQCGSSPVFKGAPNPGTVSDGEPSDDDRGSPIVKTHGELGPVLVSSGDEFAAL